MPPSVIVVGAGIGGLTAAYDLSNAGADVVVLEASNRVGGRMTTDRRDGYVIDRGAQFLSDGYAVIGQLISDLGLGERLARTDGWIASVRGGRGRRVNARRPWTVATSGLLSWRDAFRMARATISLLRSSARLPLSDYSAWHRFDDDGAAEWIAAQFGRAALEYVFEPLLEGLYFQAPEQMSRAWPAIVWSFGARGKGITTLTTGLGSLPEAIAGKVNVSLNTPVVAIDSAASGVTVTTSAGNLSADAVVLATTASVARRLYRAQDDVETRLLNTGYSATINLSVATSAPVPLAKNIYGLLIPRRERRVIASVALESRKCRHYVERGELLNVMLSGTASSRLLEAPDDRLLVEVLPELQQYFPKIDQALEFVSVARWPEAEPYSPVGRSRDVRLYRETHRGAKVILAGDYMGLPCTEGAAESGRWAAGIITSS